MNKCKFCARAIGILEAYYAVRTQTKQNGLWVQTGRCCEDCLESNKHNLNIQSWRSK